MKNTIIKTIVLLVFFTQISWAQTEVCRVDTSLFYEYIPGTEIKELKYRIIHTYDSENREIEFLRQNWILASSTWLNFSKWEYTYNSNNLKLTQTKSNWNTVSNTFEFIERATFTYNAQNKETQTLWESWNTTSSSWTNSLLLSSDYDANGNLLIYIRRGWASGAWQYVEMDESTYDANNNRTQYERFWWNTSTNGWQYDYMLQESYDNNNRLVERVRLQLNTSTSVWENYMRWLYQYDNSNNQTQQIYQTWQDWDNTWAGGQRTLYNYGPNNTPSGSLTQYWNNNTNAYDINVSNVQYTYDAFLNNTIIDTKVWDAGSASWQNSAKQTREFDNNNFLVVYENMFNWNPSISAYNTRNRTEYVCSLMDVSSIENEALTGIMVYPNPVESNGTITIQVNTAQAYTITDATGKICLSGKLQNGENQVALGALNSGIYFLRTQTDVRKLVIQ